MQNYYYDQISKTDNFISVFLEQNYTSLLGDGQQVASAGRKDEEVGEKSNNSQNKIEK